VRQAVDARNSEHVVLVERRNRTGELWPIGPCPAHLFTEDLDGVCGLQGLNLRSMILFGGGDARIAVFQHCQLATDLCNGQSRCAD
jgi:hypothetical protein